MNELTGYDTSKIKGLEKLSVNGKMFIGFLKNFYKSWEHPEEHTPVKVVFKKDKVNGAYLRVDCADGKWYHVKSATKWY